MASCSFSSNGHGRIAAAEWIRTAYHDVATADASAGTGGLDASIMFEVDRAENIGTGFNTTLGSLTGYYSLQSSMADLLALAVYASVRSCKGPIIPFRAGRVDATAGGPLGVPDVLDDIETLTEKFARQGFNQTEMIGLVACGHTLGGVHGADFPTVVPGLGTSGLNISYFDTTKKFDSVVATEYISGNTTNPLVNGPDASRHSDLRVFSSDNNATMTSLQSPSTFQDTCAVLMQKMIDTVPSTVTLTDPIIPYDVKPGRLSLAVSTDGSTITFSGELRVQTTTRPSSDIASVQMLYTNKAGEAAGTIKATAATFQGGKVAGFDTTYQFYTFNSAIPAATAISAFNVSITLNDGTVETHDNNGASFPVNSVLALQYGSSCMQQNFTGGQSYMTVVAALAASQAGDSASVRVETTVRMPRQGVIVPSLETGVTVMEKVAGDEAATGWVWWSAHVPIGLEQSTNSFFDLVVGSGDGAVRVEHVNVNLLTKGC